MKHFVFFNLGETSLRFAELFINILNEMQAFENMKLIQIDKFNKATDFEKESIELDPIKIFAKAVENCKPLLKLEKISRGGVLYQVILFGGFYCINGLPWHLFMDCNFACCSTHNVKC